MASSASAQNPKLKLHMDGRFKFVYQRRFKICRNCWSFRRRYHEGLAILPPIRDQGERGTCLYNAICAVMEAKLRLKGISVKLSAESLETYCSELLASLPKSQERSLFIEVPLILQNLKSVGIQTEEDYKKNCLTGHWYRISGYQSLTWFKMTTPYAVEKLRKSGPLLAVIQVSKNYTLDFLSGRIYRFDNTNANTEEGQTKTHAVMVTGYGIDVLLAFWEMMNSHGEVGKQKGFGCFDFGSLIGLYSLDVVDP